MPEDTNSLDGAQIKVLLIIGLYVYYILPEISDT